VAPDLEPFEPIQTKHLRFRRPACGHIADRGPADHARPKRPSTMTEQLTVGVEEEFLIVDPLTRQLKPAGPSTVMAGRALMGEQVTPEFRMSQIETGTRVTSSLSRLRAELVRLRRELAAAARRTGHRLVSTGTHRSRIGGPIPSLRRTGTGSRRASTSNWPGRSSCAAATSTSGCPMPIRPSTS
jgi:hypothetical protein